MGVINFPRKTNPSEDSASLKDLESLEMKLINTINGLDDVKAKIDESSLKILEEIKATFTDMLGQFKSMRADMETLSDFVKHVPKETLLELSNIKKSQPIMYDELKLSINENINKSVLNAVDTGILTIVKGAGKLDSHDLLEKVEAARVCSKNTFFSHLSRLEDKGFLVRKMSGHKAMYSVTEAVALELDKKAAAGKIKNEAPAEVKPAEAPVKPAESAPQPPVQPKTQENAPQPVQQPPLEGAARQLVPEKQPESAPYPAKQSPKQGTKKSDKS